MQNYALKLIWILIVFSTMHLSANAATDFVSDGSFSGTVTNAKNGGYDLGPWTISSGTLWAQFSGTPPTGTSLYSNENGVKAYTETLPYGSFVNDIEPVLTASPAGGDYFGDDGHYPVTISQSITGLTVGTVYSVAFYQAAAVEAGAAVWPSSTLSVLPINWLVTLGSTSQDSPVINLTPKAGDLAYGHTTPVSSVTTSNGWELVNLLFTATSSKETLSFLAQGPGGVPPISLLSDVTLSAESAVPEPSQRAIFMLGLPMMVWMTRRKNANS